MIRLELIRRMHNLTLKELGEICDVHGSTISCWETGASKPRKALIKQTEENLKSFGIKYDGSAFDPIDSSTIIMSPKQFNDAVNSEITRRIEKAKAKKEKEKELYEMGVHRKPSMAESKAVRSHRQRYQRARSLY